MFASRLDHQLLLTPWRPEQRASTLRQTFQEVEMRRQTSCPPTTYSIAQVLLKCKSSVTIHRFADTGWPNVFKLVFHKNPLSSPTDFKLEVKMLPLQISYHEAVFSDLLDFLFLPQTLLTSKPTKYCILDLNQALLILFYTLIWRAYHV